MAGGTTHALEGIRILDLGHFLAAPRCGQILGELGATVVKIEPPQGETMRILMSLAKAERILAVVNTNKRGISLNLKSDAGQALFLKLVAAADVVLENFGSGTMDRLGLGYGHLAEVNPGLVYASISGFGNTGPQKNRGAFDIIAQATSGIMDALGLPDRPPGIFFADLVSGAYAAMAIVAALFVREKTGKGQQIDISMQDVMYAHHFRAHAVQALGDAAEETTGMLGRSVDNLLTDHEHPLPFWNTYRTKDGHVAIVALTDRHWERLMKAIGHENLLDDARFANFITRIHNAPAGVEILSRWAADRTVDEVVRVLNECDVPCGKVCSTQDVKVDPQLAERGMVNEVQHSLSGPIRVPGSALKMSVTPGEISRPHPGLGEHTEEVLREFLDMDDEEIAEWKSRGAI
ncbi:MAG TPA: CoA transferase [Candidatus Hydrogenedentes bacterium]|nr:CoA transferase [Candidatus Hydrogenedentota bacterium]